MKRFYIYTILLLIALFSMAQSCENEGTGDYCTGKDLCTQLTRNECQERPGCKWSDFAQGCGADFPNSKNFKTCDYFVQKENCENTGGCKWVDIPNGSFIKTCKECVLGNKLSCKCKNFIGSWVRSSLQLPCSSDIANCDGQLTCGRCQQPKGSYQRSCTSCTVVAENKLKCKCRNAKGVLKQSTLNLPCSKDIANCNGNLICGGPCVPSGSFQKSCKKCYGDGLSYISCQCKDVEGNWTNTTYSNLPCNGDIINCDGVLLCNWCQKGSYQRSCKDCKLNGNMLTCSCKRINGTYQNTSINKSCTKDVANCDGTLKCGGC